MDTNHGFGVWLRVTRTQAGLSQQKVAAALAAEGLNVRQQTIDRIERGQREGIPLHLAVALAQLLGTTLDAALGLKAGPDSVAAERHARRTLLLAQIRDQIDMELRGAQ